MNGAMNGAYKSFPTDGGVSWNPQQQAAEKNVL